MVVARTRSVALLGLAGSIVDVEADLANGLPSLGIIGLPDTALAESRERVRSAAANSGCALPGRRLTVNLSPASLPKHGSGFDLAIALACLGSARIVSPGSLEQVVHIGELALDGRVRPIRGVLAAVAAAVGEGMPKVMVATGNAAEARLVPGAEIIAVASLTDAAIWHGADLSPVEVDAFGAHAAPVLERDAESMDLADVIGQDDAILAMMAAAAGGHHMFLLGPPGAGKTMIARRMTTILPDLDTEAALESMALASLAGANTPTTLNRRPPFEAPHHSTTPAALIGGGSGMIRPGAAARASNGILFLDEAPEFPASALDALRQPLESGVISVHRANAVATFPGRFQLVLAANPCPCGNYGSTDGECSCPPNARRKYLHKISGPLLDRVDIRLTLSRVTAAHMRAASQTPRMTTERARARVVEARDAAAERLRDTPWSLNAHVPGPWLRKPALHPGGNATAALDRALERGAITMRGYDRVLRLAWSMADLDGASRPDSERIGRALFVRNGVAS